MQLQVPSSSSNNTSQLIPWNGDPDGAQPLIDRFDVRNSIDFLSTSDVGPGIDLDPTNEHPQLLPISLAPFDKDELAFNFERYRDLIENDICDRSEDGVILYIDGAWNDLIADTNEPASSSKRKHTLRGSKSRSASSSTSSTTVITSGTVQSEPAGQLFREMTMDQSIVDVIQDADTTDLDILNIMGRDFLIPEAGSMFLKEHQEKERLSNNEERAEQRGSKGSLSKSRKRLLGTHNGIPLSSKLRKTDREVSSSNDEEDLSTAASNVVIEFTTSDPLAGSTESEAPAELALADDSIAAYAKPNPSKQPRLGSLSRNIFEAEFAGFSRASEKLSEESKAGKDDAGDAGFDFRSNKDKEARSIEVKPQSALSRPSQQTDEKPLSASERLKMKAKLALSRQIVNDEKSLLFKKRGPDRGVKSVTRQRGTSPDVDEFGRIRRK
ncbi:hypothetical protein BC830DRAFT_564206 [Chytriomyces sp. MP71]|nr:hypothetical protein BC830DRAFT_564206 [Chytriomyces sp. MP71]